MSHESPLVLEDNLARVDHEILKPLNRLSVTTSVDEISDTKDPRAPAIVTQKPPTTGEESHLVEQPKAVTSQGRKDAFFRSPIHIPAIFMTLGALSLTFRGVFWQAPTSYTNTILNILQFVAKVHETLIIFSLTAIVLHRLRYEIISRNGIPFGLLSAALPYSSLEILTRKDIRQVLARPRRLRRYLELIFVVVLASFLASISGPLTAIVILPRLEWWPVTPSHNTSSPIIYFNNSAFPNVVTFPQMPCIGHDGADSCYYLNRCSSNTAESLWCPSSGLQTILTSGLVRNQRDNFDGRSISPMPILVPSIDLSLIGRSIFSRSLNGNLLNDSRGNTAFVASVVPDITAMALGYFWHNGDQANGYTRPMAKTSSTQNPATGLHKPLVQVQCAGSNNTLTNSTSDVVLFPSTFHSPQGTSNASWTVPLARLMAEFFVWWEFPHTSYGWVNLSMPENIGPSAALIFLIPTSNTILLYPPTFINTLACTIDAIWIPSESWIDPTTDDTVHESITDPLLDRHHFENGSGKIQLSQSWLDMLDPWLVYPDTWGDNSTSLMQILGSCTAAEPYEDVEQRILCLESMLALYIADGLARMQSTTSRFYLWQGIEQWNYLAVQDNNDKNGIEIESDVKSWFNNFHDAMPQFTIDILQYGYGYGFHGGKTIYFATTILLIYALVALVHIAVLIIGGWSSNSWNKPGELIALAVNSPPTELLRNTCAGIEDPIMWTRVVSIRETEDNHLGIVFEEEEKDGVVDREIEVRNQSMETKGRQPELKESESGVRRRVLPGKKYGTMTSQASPTIFTEPVSTSSQISDSRNLINE